MAAAPPSIDWGQVQLAPLPPPDAPVTRSELKALENYNVRVVLREKTMQEYIDAITLQSLRPEVIQVVSIDDPVDVKNEATKTGFTQIYINNVVGWNTEGKVLTFPATTYYLLVEPSLLTPIDLMLLKSRRVTALCKSKEVVNYLSTTHAIIPTYIGFAAPPFSPAPIVKRSGFVVHLAGGASTDNTAAIWKVWTDNYINSPDCLLLIVLDSDYLYHNEISRGAELEAFFATGTDDTLDGLSVKRFGNVYFYHRTGDRGLSSQVISAANVYLQPTTSGYWSHAVTYGLQQRAHVITTNMHPYNNLVVDTVVDVVQDTGGWRLKNTELDIVTELKRVILSDGGIERRNDRYVMMEDAYHTLTDFLLLSPLEALTARTQKVIQDVERVVSTPVLPANPLIQADGGVAPLTNGDISMVQLYPSTAIHPERTPFTELSLTTLISEAPLLSNVRQAVTEEMAARRKLMPVVAMVKL